MTTFYILSFQKSGSHMLASALDSHPDIQCTGETEGKYKWLGSTTGKVYGSIIHSGDVLKKNNPRASIDDVEKIILLLRDHSKRQHDMGLKDHYLSPTTVQKREQPQHFSKTLNKINKAQEDMKHHIKNKDHIVVDYDDLTNNKDIRIVDDFHTKLICDFLDVDICPLTPAFYRPNKESNYGFN